MNTTSDTKRRLNLRRRFLYYGIPQYEYDRFPLPSLSQFITDMWVVLINLALNMVKSCYFWGSSATS
jgi:hypothetical protein